MSIDVALYDDMFKDAFYKILGNKPDFEDFYKWNLKRVQECVNDIEIYENEQYERAGISLRYQLFQEQKPKNEST